MIARRRMVSGSPPALMVRPTWCVRLLAAFAVATLNLGCAGNRSERTFRDALAHAVSTPGGTSFDLASAMPIPWDTVVILQPYASQAVIDSMLGFHWQADAVSVVMHDDRANALVFVHRGRVEQAIVVERREGDFCCSDAPQRYSRNEAVFDIVMEAGRVRLRHR